MTAIRPDLPSIPARADTALRPAARDAQAAFFRAAMGQVEAPPQPQTQAPVQAQAILPPSTPIRTAPPPEPPAPGRPGSLLDIRV